MDPPIAPGWWRTAVDLLVPAACLGCGRPGTVLCGSCERTMHRRPAAVRVGRAAPPVWVATDYRGVVRSALVAHKERGARRLTLPLGRALAAAVAAATLGCPFPIALVPVPSTPRAVRSRGDDTVLALARSAARALRAGGTDAVAVAALRHNRAVADSRGLGAAARRSNLAGAFAVEPHRRARLRGRRVVVVDDLVTTGASVTEAVRALRCAGVAAAVAAAVAGAPGRSP